MALSKKQRQALREKFGGRCAYCGEELPEKGWHADHIKPIIRDLPYNTVTPDRKTLSGSSRFPERDVIENMNPSCAPCNLFKSTLSIETFRRELAAQAERANKNVNFRFALKYNLIKLTPQPIVFYFEKYQDSTDE